MSDSEVDEYLRLPEGYESRPSSPEPERTRELELATVYRQKTATTTKSDVAQKLKERYLVADASVQTSAGDGAKKADRMPVESHLEVSLERFEVVLLSGNRSSPDLDEAVDSVLQNSNFQGWMENYFRDVESDSVDEHAPSPESDPAEDLMKAFNMIMASHPESDDTHPYNLRFLLENHFVERPEPHELPQAAAILDSGSDGPWDWSDIAVFVEFGAVKFESQLEELSRQIPVGKTAETEFRTHTATLDSGPSRQWSPSRKRDVSPSASIDDPCPPKRPRRQSTRAERSGGVPSHFSGVGKTSAAASPKHPKHKPPAELARCALEVFHSRGNRRHVLGLSLAHRGARFWYFDRAGSIRTPQLTLNQRPFVRALMRFAFCGAAQLGLEDVFVPPGSNPSPSPPIFNTVEGWLIQVQGSTFTINEALHSAEELYGRGTAVFSVTSRAVEEPSGPYPLPRNVVLKLSWQLTSWHDEDALYRLAAEHDVQGISRLYRSASLSRLSHGFRGRLVDGTHFCDRELRAQVLGPLCVPLYRVTSLDNFKKAFIALVKAHRQLYERAGILHHDISVNNLMVDANDHSVGVLIDLDLAVRLKDGERQLTFEPVPAGTLAFRAIDVLWQGEIVHELRYRYDLESFFYALVWILTYYPHSFSTPVCDWSEWYNAPPFALAHSKTGMFFRASITMPDGPLKESWLLKLANLFVEGQRARALDKVTTDKETMGGYLTYQNFMTVLDPELVGE